MNRISTNNKYFIFDEPKAVGAIAYMKSIFLGIISACYKAKMNLFCPEIKEKKYKVSVCAIFKNEAVYLKEWIEFNHIVGIEHFYMYNNNSVDDFEKIIKPYIDTGLVTLIDWPYDQKQMECYKDCMERFSSETKWLGFIDLDEFIVPKLTDNVYDFLKRFEKNRGAVCIYWKMFGSSGLISRDIRGLITENFTVSWPQYCDIGKCFFNTAYEFDSNSKYANQLHHRFWAKWKGWSLPPVNIFDCVCIGNRNIAKQTDFPIQINHYFTKSYEEYEKKKTKGDVYFKINPHDEEYFYEHEMKNMAVDYSIFKYIVKLKLAMKATDVMNIGTESQNKETIIEKI